ncbi:MAG: FecR domain-containing protein [Adhaeribacter sp.]
MDQEKFVQLVHKYLAGEASAEEEKVLFRHYDLLQQQHLEWDPTQMGEEKETRNRLYLQVQREIKRRESRWTRSPLSWAVAASLVLALLSGVLLYRAAPRPELAVSKNTARPLAGSEIVPGGNRATLTLGDGTRIDLDQALTGELARQSGMTIRKAADGRIVYVSAQQKETPAVQLTYHTIETPQGGQYQVMLPDGTQVWLNAGSRLRYPSRFTGGRRQVELSGEAYFEVSPDKAMPFRVLSRNQVVQVLGTHFNVSAYENEEAVKTTLLEGAVRISLPQGHQSKLLQPGQQAQVGGGSAGIWVQAVEVEKAVAWKNGYFMFEDEDLESIMRQLERWYDVKVTYAGQVKDIRFGGMVSRSKSLDQALRILELTGNIHFKIEGRRVTVMP